MELNSSVILRFEILLWLSGCENVSGHSRHKQLTSNLTCDFSWAIAKKTCRFFLTMFFFGVQHVGFMTRILPELCLFHKALESKKCPDGVQIFHPKAVKFSTPSEFDIHM